MPELGCAPPRAPCGGGEGGAGGGYPAQLDPCGGGGCAPQLAPSLPPLQSPQLFRRSLSVRWVENKSVVILAQLILSDLSSIGSVEQVTVLDSTFAAISAIPSPVAVKHQKYLDTAASVPHLDR